MSGGSHTIGPLCGRTLNWIPNRSNNGKGRSKPSVGKALKSAVSASSPVIKNMIKRALMEGGSRAGGYLGGQIGVPQTGRKLGSALAARVSKLVGSGEYTLGGDAQVNSLIKGGVPATISFGDKTTRLTHREFIGDIYCGAQGAFRSSQFVVNADYSTTFPYLAGIATQFEKYRFKGLVFEYISTVSPLVGSGTAGALSSLGSVVMACQFNTSAPPFVSKTQMENTENAISVRTDQNCLYGVECKDQVQNWYYTRHIGASAGVNANVGNIYDLCDFSIATVGGPSGSTVNDVVGELWVTYDVELTGPRLPDVRSGYIHGFASTGVASTTPFGATANQTIKNYGITGDVTVNGKDLLLNNLTSGDFYMLTYCARGSADAACTMGFTITNGATVNYFNNATQYRVVGSAVTTSTFQNSYVFKTTGPSCKLSFNSSSTADPVLPGGTTVTAEWTLSAIAFSVSDTSI